MTVLDKSINTSQTKRLDLEQNAEQKGEKQFRIYCIEIKRIKN
jgi:hypothetical protein